MPLDTFLGSLLKLRLLAVRTVSVPDLNIREVRWVYENADLGTMRLQLIRAFNNETVLRVMVNQVVIEDV